MNDNEIESLVAKIDKEISEVRNHVTTAKESLRNNNYNDAIKHLQEAEKVSTCSYCKQKLNFFIANANYSDTLCGINYKTCEDTKQNTLHEMQQFIDKLPSVSDIRKRKASTSASSEDPLQLILKSFDEMGKAFLKTFGWQ